MKHSYSFAVSGSAILLTGCLFVTSVHGNEPAVRDVLLQCRHLSLDQSGFEECLEVLDRESELALAGIESDWLELLDAAEQSSATESTNEVAVSEPEQMRLMAARFLEFRDQTCAFSVAGLDDLTASAALQACRVSMNRDRLGFLQRQYIERRAQIDHGAFYRGYLLMTADRGLFQSCEHRQDWVIDGDDVQTREIVDRYDTTTTETLELVYMEVRGSLQGADGSAPVLQVNRLNMLRPVTERDCTGPVVETPADDAADDDNPDADIDDDTTLAIGTDSDTGTTAQLATIDNYGAAGFIYGYFGEWTTICAAEAQQVCQAQAQHSLSTQGDWELLIDRSSSRQWRVRLMPTTDSHIVGSDIQLSIDGVAITTVPVASQQLLLEQSQVLMHGDNALQLINRLKSGGTFELSWNDINQSAVSLIFALNGVTLALDSFGDLGN
ncbi:MAG: hypothetical protein AAF404_02150 [Pseudomonadota bacterium]